MSKYSDLAELVIILKDGTSLHVGKVEIVQKIRVSSQAELVGMVREKQRITEPILN